MLVPAGPLSSEEALPTTAISSFFFAMACVTRGKAKSGTIAPAAVMHSLASLATAAPPVHAHSSATTSGLIPLLPRGLRLLGRLVAQVAIRDFVPRYVCTTKSRRLSQPLKGCLTGWLQPASRYPR